MRRLLSLVPLALAACGSARNVQALDAAAPVVEASAPYAACASSGECSEDPALAAVAGQCLLDASLPAGFCQCAQGFSSNLATGRCRVGSACEAAAADAWDLRMPLDATDCESRVLTRCQTSDRSDEAVSKAFDSLMTGACQLPSYVTIRIVFTDGCPTSLEARDLSHGMVATRQMAFFDCIGALLPTLRFDYAEGMACVMEERDTLP